MNHINGSEDELNFEFAIDRSCAAFSYSVNKFATYLACIYFLMLDLNFDDLNRI